MNKNINNKYFYELDNIENYILTSIDDNYELLLEDTNYTNQLLLTNNIDDDIRERIYTRRDEIIEERKQIINEFSNENQIDDGDYVLLAAFGAGFTWGSMLIKWDSKWAK